MLHSHHQTRLACVAALTLLFATPVAAAEPLPTADQLQTWGEEALALIDRDLWMPDRGLYAEQTSRGQQEPAFMWSCGVQLSALNAAARLNPEKYTPRLVAYADALQIYWKEHRGVSGYDVLPAPAPPDRYYDDNAWIVLTFVELYELTGDERWIERADATLRFVFSGEDAALGGGLYWREKERTSKNTCTNAPAIVGALRLHQLKQERDWLAAAERTQAWTAKQLQDVDGLYLDNIRVGGEGEGRIDARKFTYNTALMIRANVLFYEITGEARWLAEAQRLARAAETRWIAPDTGAIRDGGRFAHLLVDALLTLHAADHDQHWLDVSQRALSYLHAQLRDEEGRYAGRWDRPASDRRRGMTLLDQASAARAFLTAAEALRNASPPAPSPE